MHEVGLLGEAVDEDWINVFKYQQLFLRSEVCLDSKLDFNWLTIVIAWVL
jgi:hypothetical protein